MDVDVRHRVDQMDFSLKESFEKRLAPRMTDNATLLQGLGQCEHVATQNTGTTDQVSDGVNEALCHSHSPNDDTEAKVKASTLKDCNQQPTGQFSEDKPQICDMNTTMMDGLLDKLLRHADIQDGRVQIVCGPVRITRTSSRFRKRGERQARQRRRSRPIQCGQNHLSEDCKEHPSKPQEDESQVEREIAAPKPVEDQTVHLIDPNGIEHVFPFKNVKTWNVSSHLVELFPAGLGDYILITFRRIWRNLCKQHDSAAEFRRRKLWRDATISPRLMDLFNPGIGLGASGQAR